MARRRFAPSTVVSGLVLIGALTVACFSGVKYVRDGEPCVTGDQVFEGSVECREGLTCLAFHLFPGGRRGTCVPACDAQRVCAAELVCAADVCTEPCSSECPRNFGFSGVCCTFPLEGSSACLPVAACEQAGGSHDAGADAGTDDDAGDDTGESQ